MINQRVINVIAFRIEKVFKYLYGIERIRIDCGFIFSATKRQDDWRPEQNTGWSGAAGSTTVGGERTSRGHTVQGASFSTPTWQVSASGSAVQPTKKPDSTNYMSNVIDEPNQQGLAQTGAAPGSRVPGIMAVAIPVLLVLTKITL